MKRNATLPKHGIAPGRLLRAMHAAKSGDAKWKSGHTWSLVYHLSEDHTEHLIDVYRLFFAENALSPTAFPSLKKFESDVVRIMARLVGGGERAAGTMTSGGTESILLGVKTHRDWFRSRHPKARRCKLIVPATAHPAFFKAAAYFDMEPVTIQTGPDFRLDSAEVAKAIDKNTAMLVGSAPSYPYGIVDPIRELGAIAQRHDIGLHVDACLGGAFLPFMRKLGHPIPEFDFSVPGVSSMSVDLHKYGFSCKGTSVVLYRDSALRRHQFFVKPDWLGGAYASAAMLGTRSGGGIASAWAALMMLGENGYMDLVRRTLSYRDRLWKGIRAIDGLELVGEPDMSVFCFRSTKHDIFSIGAKLEKRGWRIDRQNNPPAIHMIVTPNHRLAVSAFLRDLKNIVATEPLSKGKAPAAVGLYGVTSSQTSGANPVESLYRGLESNYE